MTGKLYSELVRGRRSVRTFDGKGISEEIKAQLQVFADRCDNPYGIPMELRFLNAREHEHGVHHQQVGRDTEGYRQ